MENFFFFGFATKVKLHDNLPERLKSVVLRNVIVNKMQGVGGQDQGEKRPPSRGRGFWPTPTVTTATTRPSRWRPLEDDYKVSALIGTFVIHK